MIFLRASLLAMVLAAIASPALSASPIVAQATSGNRPFVGVWKLNPGKSHVSPRPGYAIYRQFRADQDGWMFHTVISITPKGISFLFTAARYDGKPYPDFTPGSLSAVVKRGTKPRRTVSFIRINAHQIRWTDRVQGEVVAGGTETVSPDGRALTITNRRPGQKTMTMQVFDRVSGTGDAGAGS